jgi:hypothetical protein
MPELVTCPACGCRIQLAELFLGRPTRCIACGHRFIAAPDVGAPARDRQEDSPYPVATPPAPPVEKPQTAGRSHQRLPLCPGCHRPVGWEALECPECGHLLDPLDAFARGDWIRRRDAQPHRGQAIDTLGTLCLFGGALSLCIAPLAVPVALGFGIPALVMARGDLEEMEKGGIDPEGKGLTEFGRNKAIVGMVLAPGLGLLWMLAYLAYYR